MPKNNLIIIRGGGDLATGVVQKFHRSGFPVLILETNFPTAIRRNVSLCEAIYDNEAEVEDMICRRINDISEIENCQKNGEIPIMVDPNGRYIKKLKPAAVIDSILAKRNLGTTIDMAPITIGLGPGFFAGSDVHAVIETKRGHNLGRLILEGSAIPNTGIPGEIGGKSLERVIKSPASGEVKHIRKIGDIVEEGEDIFEVSGIFVKAPFKGLLRGLIREKIFIEKGTKSADIDPRTDVDWNGISDKARCLGGAALEAYLYLSKENNL